MEDDRRVLSSGRRKGKSVWGSYVRMERFRAAQGGACQGSGVQPRDHTKVLMGENENDGK